MYPNLDSAIGVRWQSNTEQPCTSSARLMIDEHLRQMRELEAQTVPVDTL